MCKDRATRIHIPSLLGYHLYATILSSGVAYLIHLALAMPIAPQSTSIYDQRRILDFGASKHACFGFSLYNSPL